MTSRAIALLGALSLMVATSAAAQPSAGSLDEGGKVARIERGSSVVVLEDGRMFRVSPSTVVLVDNRPVTFDAIQPGSTVILRSGEPVVYRDGQYVVVAPAATAVVPAVRQTVYGRVTDVDRDGQITVKTGKGEFEMRVSPDAARNIKKGDTVTLDVTVTPPGRSPAASPATR